MQEKTYFNLIQNKDKEEFVKELDSAILSNVERIKRRKKARIAFQISTIDTWIGDSILDFFSEDVRFEVCVVYAWQKNMDYSKERNKFEKKFSSLGYTFLFAGKDVNPGDFDIIFFTSPYLSALEFFSSKDIPQTTLVCYIPYSFLLADLQEGQFNLFIHNICWKNYIFSSFYFEMAEKYCDVKTHGMVYSGYPKMDILKQKTFSNSEWKFSKGQQNDNCKKIIYAPHHSIDVPPYFSTFDKNYIFFLEYAKAHIEDTSWIIKPHPLLASAAIRKGIFSDMNEYYDYLNEWNSLPNARVVEGEYTEWFLSSDCMILDSVSFLAEYLYTGKPMLFLTRSRGGFNEFGHLVSECLCKVDGNDYKGIDSFICNVKEYDEYAKKRKVFYDQYLNYWDRNGMSASEFIYKDVERSVFG